MLWIICHAITGAYYRAELGVKNRSDVCRYESILDLHLRAEGFDTKLFDCLKGDSPFRRNCMAIFCSPVIFAADSAATGLMSFWLALVLTSLFWPLIIIFGFVGRLRIRHVFNMHREMLADILTWLLCCPCALVQEHRFMKKAFLASRRGQTYVEILPEECPQQPPPASTTTPQQVFV